MTPEHTLKLSDQETPFFIAAELEPLVARFENSGSSGFVT